MTTAKNTTLEITVMQKIFIITGISFAIACFIIVYLNDSNIVPIGDVTYYKILAVSSMTSVGSYLFGSSTARK